MLGSEAGDAIGGCVALCVGDDVCVSVYAEALADIGKVQIVVELGAAPDPTDSQSSGRWCAGGVAFQLSSAMSWLEEGEVDGIDSSLFWSQMHLRRTRWLQTNKKGSR